MSQRTTTIALSNDEKERLDDIARDLCGTAEVPYGVALTQLIDEYRRHTETNGTEDAIPA